MIAIFELTVLAVLATAGEAVQRRPYYSNDPHSEGEPPRLFYPGDVPARPNLHADEAPRPFYSGDPPPHGFQFSSFRGPVSGSIKEITVPYNPPPLAGHPHLAPAGTVPQQGRGGGHHKSTSFDYVAKPDYAFTFGVQDPESGNAQTREESRDGDTVRGEYRVMEPDGTLRTVTYSADPINGFQASVKYGPSGLPPPPPPTPPPTSGYTGVQESKYRAPPPPRQNPQHRFKVDKRPAYKSYEEYDDF